MRRYLLVQIQPGSTMNGTVTDPDEWIEGRYWTRRAANRACIGRLCYVTTLKVWDAKH